MAIAPQNEDVFFREVDEELRRDQLGGMWRRYGRLVVAAIIVALLAFAGYLYWQHRQAEQAGLAGEQLSTALRDVSENKPDAAKPVLATLGESDIAGYRATARLTAAALALDKGDDKAAIAQYSAITADTGLAQPFRDLALIRQTAVEYDTLPPATVVERLKPLAIAGNPWFGSAGELVALAYQKMGKAELAGPLFAAMAKDKDVPETIRTRALRLAGLLGMDAVAQPAALLGNERMKRFAIGLALLASLSGCGIFSGGEKRPKTAVLGERMPILNYETGAEVDPALADVAVALPAAAINGEWTQPGGNAAKSMGSLAVGQNLAPAWSVRIAGSSPKARLAAAPVVAGDRVYVIDTDAVVHAFTVADGKPVWTAATGAGDESKSKSSLFGGGVSFDNGRLYATNGLGDVVALDATNGSVLWKKRPGGPLRGSPTIANDNLYVVSQDNQLFALKTTDGSTIWNEAGTLELAGVFGVAAPAAAQGTVVAGFSSGELNAYRYENGRGVWQDALSRTSISTAVASLSDIDADPVIDQGRVYAVGQGGRMVALELTTGQRLWEINVAGISTPWVVGDWMFVVTDEAKLLCVARATGKVRWLTQLPRYRDDKPKKGTISWTGPVLAGDRLILASSEGQLANVSPTDGKLLSTGKAGAPVFLSPVVASQTLFLLDNEGHLTAWR